MANNNTTLNLINKCASCAHAEVCKYKKNFEKLMEDIKNIYPNLKIPKMFNLDIICNQYYEHCRTIDPTKQPTPLNTPIIVPSPQIVPSTPSITVPDLTPVFTPKITCEADNTNSITTTNGISINKL